MMSRFIFREMSAANAARLSVVRAELAALRFQRAALLLGLALKNNFNSSQPRVSAGNPDGGQWTPAGGSASDLVRVAANGQGPLVPGGTYSLPASRNPLDPAGMNPLSLPVAEQQQVADTVNALNAGDQKMLRAMQGHSYANHPSQTTGAALPPSAAGYRTYYIGPKTGKKRLLVDKATGQMYYTNNHYLSFWLIVSLGK